jgi:CHASE2 domain-containing sensor protein
VRKYFLPAFTTLFVVGLYYFFDIRLFNLDVMQEIREHLFKLKTGYGDESIIILNSGKLSSTEVKLKIDSLLSCHPAVVGINPCHLEGDVLELKKSFEGNDNVIFAECERKTGTLGRIVNDDNSVTHFKHDNTDYFEFKVDFRSNPPFHQKEIAKRKEDVELIDFVEARKSFYRYYLETVVFTPELFSGKTVLIGYLGDYFTDSAYYFDERRVTPMNRYYGYDHIEPDTYDTEISAIIVSQLDNKIFINEISDVSRVFILFLLCVLAVLLLTFSRTRWLALNIFIAFVMFILLVMGAGWMIVYTFLQGYYINLDELPLALLIVSVFTIIHSVTENKKRNQVIADGASTK